MEDREGSVEYVGIEVAQATTLRCRCAVARVQVRQPCMVVVHAQDCRQRHPELVMEQPPAPRPRYAGVKLCPRCFNPAYSMEREGNWVRRRCDGLHSCQLRGSWRDA